MPEKPVIVEAIVAPTLEPVRAVVPAVEDSPLSIESQPAQLFSQAHAIVPTIESPAPSPVVEVQLQPIQKIVIPQTLPQTSPMRVEHPQLIQAHSPQTPAKQIVSPAVVQPLSRFVIPSLSSQHRTVRSLHPKVQAQGPSQPVQILQAQVQLQAQAQPSRQLAIAPIQQTAAKQTVGFTAPKISAPKLGASGVLADRGVLRGSFEPPQDPVARIAWGDASQALRTMDIGRMVLVIVDAELKIVGGIDGSGDTWRRTNIPSNLSTYSNRVRVVDHIPGFSIPRSVCQSTEHLAVIIPVGLERRIEKSMDSAAKRMGLQRKQVAACYGTLISERTGLEFAIDRIERRN